MSKIGKCGQSSRDISSISKKVPSSNSNLVSRVPGTSKQVSSCIPNQFSRIPNSSKQVSSCNSVPTSKIPNSSKQLGAIPKTTKPQLSRNPSSNQGPAKKPSAGNNLKTNQVQVKSKVQPVVSSPASSLNGSSSTKGFQSRIGVFGPASSLKGSSSTKGFQSRIANPVSVLPRRNPVQSKLPVTSSQKQISASNKKLPSAPSVGTKLPAVSCCQKSNPGLVKKPGLASKKAFSTLGNQKLDRKVFPASTANSRKEPIKVEKVIPEEKDNEPLCSADSKPESILERNIDISEVFDCDVSVIKRAPSFAPENFKFQPPLEVLDFSFIIGNLSKMIGILSKIKELTSRTSTPSKLRMVIHKCYEDEETMHKPSEGVNFEDNISTPPQQPSESPVKDKYVEELIQPPSEHLDVEVNTKIITSNPVQDYKRNEDDNEILQRSSKNIEIESNNSSPLEDLAQSSEKSPLRINVQDSCDSSQPVCQNIVASDEEMPLKNLEKAVSEIRDLNILSKGENSVKNKNISLNVFQNAFQKRRSILKSSTLNSISEADDDLSLSPVNNAGENKENIIRQTLRCSRTVSNLLCLDESPSTTPRCSGRISKLITIDESPSTTPRRSLRLQNKVLKENQLNDLTPKGSSHTDLRNGFDQLALEDFDEMKPEDYLIFDDSPEKISLLYSPDKRLSIRRSIRGDLMSFSPNN